LPVYLLLCNHDNVRKNFDNAVSDLLHSIGLMVRRVRAAASHELSLTEASVVARLARDGAATVAELARAECMRPQSMGATVAALEEMGLVERTPHPTDGRQVNIELTAKGVAARKSARDAKRNWLAREIAQLPAEEQEALFQAGEIMKRILEK
jgi:DNA-binding MarR family transcriptional regulator